MLKNFIITVAVSDRANEQNEQQREEIDSQSYQAGVRSD